MAAPGLVIIVTACLAGSHFAQVATGQPAAALQTGTIAGMVVSSTGMPLAKATLTLSRAAVPSNGSLAAESIHSILATNDSDGKFVIQDVPPGEYYLMARRAGYLQGRFGARTPRSDSSKLRISPGVRITDVNLTLTPQGIIRGTVTDEDGDLLESQNVQIAVGQVTRDEYGKARLNLRAGGMINADGSFIVGNLEPGRYYVSANRPEFVNDPRLLVQTKNQREPYVTTYYPSSLDSASAIPIDVTAGGDVRGITIRLRRSSVYEVRGNVTNLPEMDESGRKNCRVQMQLVPRSRGIQMIFNSAQVNCADGSFVFRNVLPGEHILIARAEPIPGPSSVMQDHQFAQAPVIVDHEDVQNIHLALGPAPQLPGVLQTNGNTPIPPATQVFLSPDDPYLGQGGANASPGPDGSLRFLNLTSGRYRVAFNLLPSDTYVKSIRFAGQEIDSDGVDLTTPNAAATLEILLSGGAPSLSGMVRDKNGDPRPTAVVVAWKSQQPAIQLYPVQSTDSDAQAAFQLTRLSPGTYYIAAWDELEYGLAHNRDFLAKFEAQAARVELEAGTRVSVNPPLMSAEATEAEIAKLP